jgi:hypothetical protein
MNGPNDRQVEVAFEATMTTYENKVFTEFDRRTCSPKALRDFKFLLRKRLLEDKSLPAVDEIDVIKDMALDILNYHPGRPPSACGRGQF